MTWCRACCSWSAGSSWCHAQGNAAAGAGLIAEQAFGFSGSLTEGGSASSSHQGNAAALSSSLLVCLMVPWSLCLVFYFGA